MPGTGRLVAYEVVSKDPSCMRAVNTCAGGIALVPEGTVDWATVPPWRESCAPVALPQ